MQEDFDKLAKVLGIAKINELTIDQGLRSDDVGYFEKEMLLRRGGGGVVSSLVASDSSLAS